MLFRSQKDGTAGNKTLQAGVRHAHKMPGMKPLRSLLTFVVAAMVAAPAFAQRGQGQRHEARQAERGAMPPPFAERTRRGYADEAAHIAPMNAEERRQLRRDIHEAGRELYRPHPQRGSRAREADPPGDR